MALPSSTTPLPTSRLLSASASDRAGSASSSAGATSSPRCGAIRAGPCRLPCSRAVHAAQRPVRLPGESSLYRQAMPSFASERFPCCDVCSAENRYSSPAFRSGSAWCVLLPPSLGQSGRLVGNVRLHPVCPPALPISLFTGAFGPDIRSDH